MTRILVIEDEDPLRENICDFLGLEDFQVIEARNGSDGVRQAQEHIPDIILCDIMMPDLDGYGVLKELRKHSATATIPFIFLTALVDKESRRSGMGLGADDYLTKPFAYPDLLTAIKTRLERRDVVERQQLRALSNHLVESQERERRHLALELNDKVQQRLVSLKLALELNQRFSGEVARKGMGEIEDLVDELLTQIHALALDLHPTILDHLGLSPTLIWYFERYSAQTNVVVDFKHTGLDDRLSRPVETAIFRIIQEALDNVAQHAQVHEAAVHIWRDETNLTIQIDDQGIGFDLESSLLNPSAGGLTGMRERALVFNGQLTLESSPRAGTRVSVIFPLDPSLAENEQGETRHGITEMDIQGKSPPTSQAIQHASIKTEDPNKISVVLADKQDLIRGGIRRLLEAETDINIVGETDNGRDVMRLVREFKPDVLAVDYELAALSGLNVVQRVIEEHLHTRILILSTYADKAYVAEALSIGATGYILKDAGSSAFAMSVREVAAGNRYLSPALYEQAIDVYVSERPENAALSSLTNREREILNLIIDGYKNAEIAEQLVISVRTVETHRANLMRKLDLRTPADLIRYAIQHGILPVEA